MKQYKRLLVLTLMLLCTLMITNKPLLATSYFGNPLASFVGDNGIIIKSYSSNWTSQAKLESVYDELMSNTHGKEMGYLSTISIFPSDPINYPKGFTSFYHEDFSVNNKGQYVYGENSSIEIYNADAYSDISQMARVLSHEYGHHFTFYYLMTKENLDKQNWIHSEYARLRKLKNYPLMTYLGDDPKGYSHKWDIAEILAEDYVQLYGSERAKKTRDYLDVKERLELNQVDYYYFYNDFNLLPQENLDLKLAADVDGLMSYFSLLSGVKPLSVPEKILSKAPRLTAITNVFKNFNAYTWEWPSVNLFEIRDQYEYTLVLNPFDNNEYPIPLKTVTSGEKLVATSGSHVDLKKGIGIMANLEGQYEVRVFIKDKFGFMHSSEVLTHSITPKDNSKIIFKDIPVDYWANDYIYDLTNRDLVQGYPDETFRPNNNVTRAEFMAFLIRTLSDINLEKDTDESYWFLQQGYKGTAVSVGLLSHYNSNENFLQVHISREEMAQMIYSMLKFSGVKTNINYKTTLTDVENSKAYMEISVVNYYHIIDGYTDRSFKPANPATRSEAMKMISSYLSTVSY